MQALLRRLLLEKLLQSVTCVIEHHLVRLKDLPIGVENADKQRTTWRRGLPYQAAVCGEIETSGKELIARAIHQRSTRSARAFVSVNCAAVPPSLIPSELFGHEKGAFTRAVQRRLGRFELAEGGTIFLDEIGELPPETQIALLRVLQEHEFERVGGNRSIRANVRVIVATNRDLEAAMSVSLTR